MPERGISLRCDAGVYRGEQRDDDPVHQGELRRKDADGILIYFFLFLTFKHDR